MSDILERAIGSLRSEGWDNEADAVEELIAEVERLEAAVEHELNHAKAQRLRIEEQEGEIERLRSVISEPVESFGTPELISWVSQLQKTISDYPDAEWGSWPFVLMMGSHCETFAKSWHSPTIEQMAARIKELEVDKRRLEARVEFCHNQQNHAGQEGRMKIEDNLDLFK